MIQSKLSHSVYRWGVAAAGLVTSLYVMRGTWAAGNTTSMLAFLWAALVALAAVHRFELPWHRVSLTLAPAVDLAAILLFGPVPAVAIAIAGRCAACLIDRRTFRDAAVGVSEGAIAVCGAGAVFAGGSRALGVEGWVGAFDPLALPVTILTYAVVRSVLMSVRAMALQGAAPSGVVRVRLPLEIAHDLVVLPFGAVLALLEPQIGALAAFYAMLPLWLARRLSRRPTTSNEALPATIRTLMTTIDAFDPFTRGHSIRIARRSVTVARHIGVPARECEDIEYGALLHDIGRTAIHLDILQNPRPLDSSERAMLQTHPTVGYEIVRALPQFERVAEIVYAHHEQPDGHGYPRGLQGESIPVGSRIIMVAAAFDAMVRERPYRRGLPAKEAYEELRRHAGTQFFPDVVNAFIELHRAGELGNESDEEARLDALLAVAPIAQRTVA